MKYLLILLLASCTTVREVKVCPKTKIIKKTKYYWSAQDITQVREARRKRVTPTNVL